MIRTGSQLEKQTARKCFQEGLMTNRAHRLTSLHTIHRDGTKICNRSVRGERANLKGLVLGGGGGGRPDYLQKLKVPEGYEKMIDY